MTTNPVQRPPFLVFIAASLDGFIARPDGDIEWLNAASANAEGEEHGFEAFMDRIDTMIMGRATFQKVLEFDDWAYRGKRVIVLSRTLKQVQVPERLRDKVGETVELHSGTLPELLEKVRGSRGVYVDGGQVIQSFLRAGLIDELTITWIPVLLGAGIPLFGTLDHDLKLKHLRTQTFEASGFVQSVYRTAITPLNDS